MNDINEAFQAKGNGTVIGVRLQPKSSKNEIVGLIQGRLRIRVHAPPVEGAANRACAELLAKKLKISKSRVALIRGASGREKLFFVEEMNPKACRIALLGAA